MPVLTVPLIIIDSASAALHRADGSCKAVKRNMFGRRGFFKTLFGVATAAFVKPLFVIRKDIVRNLLTLRRTTVEETKQYRLFHEGLS